MTTASVVGLHVGHFGSLVGAQFWDSIAGDHGLDSDGRPQTATNSENGQSNSLPHQSASLNIDQELSGLSRYFSEIDDKPSRYVPRAVFLDLGVDSYRGVELLQPSQKSLSKHVSNGVSWVHGDDVSASGDTCRESSGSVFVNPRGLSRMGRHSRAAISAAGAALRRQAEASDRVSAFLISHSAGGGCGMGLTAAFLEVLKTEFPKSWVSTFSLFPTATMMTDILQPYNTALGLGQLMTHSDSTIILDNSALYDISMRLLMQDTSTFYDLNSIVVNLISGLSSPSRFPSSAADAPNNSTDVNILAPYDSVPGVEAHNQDLHFLMGGVCPLAPNTASTAAAPHTTGAGESFEHTGSTASPDVLSHPGSVDLLSRQLFDPANFLCTADPLSGVHLSSRVSFSGSITKSEAEFACSRAVTGDTGTASDTSDAAPNDTAVVGRPSHVKCAMSSSTGRALRGMNRTAAFLTHSTAIKSVFSSVRDLYFKMYNRKAYVHWYTSAGIEQHVFAEAGEHFHEIVEGYKQLEGQEVAQPSQRLMWLN